jgi:hypothetical protein
MSDQLPPSRFVAGYTYGGEPPAPPHLQPTNPAPATWDSTAPAYASPPDPYGHDPAYAAPPLDPGPQLPNSNLYAPHWPTVPTTQYAGSGGTAITAVVLALVGAIWHGLGAVSAVASLQVLFSWMSVAQSAGADMSASNGIYLWLIVISVVQAVIPLLLVIGAIQLIRHRSSGRGFIAFACVLIIGLAAWEIFVFYSVTGWMGGVYANLGAASSTAGEFHQIAQAGLLVAGLPALLAIVTMFFALARATKKWCERVTYAPYGPSAGY